MSESNRIADLIERVANGDPWHGDSVAAVLDGISADAAAAHPIANGHSVWELVIHMTGWVEEVEARLRGRAAGDPPAGDWPDPGETGEREWSAAKTKLFAAHSAVAATVRTLPDEMLNEPVLDLRDRAAGIGLSRYVTVHGLVHHTVYHSGQIALLRKALQRSERR
jgi:uncharacterized damage-inducible protein DinB